MATTIENTRHDCLDAGATATFDSNSFRPEVGFVLHNFIRVRRLGFAVIGNALSYARKNHIDRSRTNAGQTGLITGRQIQVKGLVQTTKFGRADLEMIVIHVLPLYI